MKAVTDRLNLFVLGILVSILGLFAPERTSAALRDAIFAQEKVTQKVNNLSK